MEERLCDKGLSVAHGRSAPHKRNSSSILQSSSCNLFVGILKTTVSITGIHTHILIM
jgi:hypothetical protein